MAGSTRFTKYTIPRNWRKSTTYKLPNQNTKATERNLTKTAWHERSHSETMKEKDRQAGFFNRTANDLQELQRYIYVVCAKPTQAREKEWKKETIVTKERQWSYTVQTRDRTLYL